MKTNAFVVIYDFFRYNPRPVWKKN